MTLKIFNGAAGVAVPEGWQELARIRCSSTPDRQPWQLPLPLLDSTSDAACDELWCVPDSVEHSPIQLAGGSIQQHHSQHYTMYWLQLDIGEFDSFAAATAYAWQQVLYSLQADSEAHKRHLAKVWHYLPAINQGEGDQEQYRQFCLGRAYSLSRADYQHPLPAATAIGIQDDNAPLVMYWLCSDQPITNIENPRQTSAWQYPRDYGPSSPNFSRASIETGSNTLLLSGTASVVGHATSHAFDTAAQTREMLTNLDKLLEVSQQGNTPYNRKHARLRVYIRDRNDWPTVQQQLLQAGLEQHNMIAFSGDICRADLMVELDGYLQP